MNKKIFGVALVLFVIYANGTAYSQSKGQSPAELIKRAKDLAVQYENLENNTRLSPKDQVKKYSEENRAKYQENIEKNLTQQSRKLDDDSSKLITDLAYAGFNLAYGGDDKWTTQQTKEILDAVRRIDNAKSQIVRNISRWY